MAPKNKSGDKAKSKDAGAEKGAGKQKGAQSVNVRHILCEKHGKKEDALAKLNAGSKFDEVRYISCAVTTTNHTKVAREFSEDKARQGMNMSNTTLALQWHG